MKKVLIRNRSFEDIPAQSIIYTLEEAKEVIESLEEIGMEKDFDFFVTYL